MKPEEESYYSLKDVKNETVLFVRMLLRKWWLVLAFAILGSAAGAAYFSLLQKPKYEAVSTFILEEKQGSLGGLSSIASQFGFDLGGGSGGSLFAGDNILDVIRSKKVVNNVLRSPIDTNTASSTLADLYLAFTGLNKRLKDDRSIENLHIPRKGPLTTVQDSVLSVIHEAILKKSLSVERMNKKGSIIKVKLNSENSQFAKLMAERLVNEAGSLYLLIKTGNAVANIQQLQRRSDSLLALLNKKSYTAAISNPLDVNPGLRTAAVPVEIATRDKAVIGTIYTEVTKNLEASKLILSQQTPIIQVLDSPGAALKDERKGLAYLLVLGGLVGGFLLVVIEALRFLLKKL